MSLLLNLFIYISCSKKFKAALKFKNWHKETAVNTIKITFRHQIFPVLQKRVFTRSRRSFASHKYLVGSGEDGGALLNRG